MANVVVCDRCEKMIATTYYKIDISAHDVKQTALNNSETISYNLAKHINDAFHGKSFFCKECINKIQKVMKDGE